MKVKAVSFEQLQRDKPWVRFRDERRLALGLVTPAQLQKEKNAKDLSRMMEFAAFEPAPSKT